MTRPTRRLWLALPLLSGCLWDSCEVEGGVGDMPQSSDGEADGAPPMDLTSDIDRSVFGTVTVTVLGSGTVTADQGQLSCTAAGGVCTFAGLPGRPLTLQTMTGTGGAVRFASCAFVSMATCSVIVPAVGKDIAITVSFLPCLKDREDRSWCIEPTPHDRHLSAISGLGLASIYAVSTTTPVLTSSDGSDPSDTAAVLKGTVLRWDGVSWRVNRSLPNENAYSVAALTVDATPVQRTGSGSSLVAEFNGFKVPALLTTPTSRVRALSAPTAAGTTLWAALESGYVYKGTLGANNQIADIWSQSYPAAGAPAGALYGIWSQGLEAWAVGVTGSGTNQILYFNGSSWAFSAPDPQINGRLFGVAGSPDGHLFAVGENGTVLHRPNGDAQWTKQTLPPCNDANPGTLRGVWSNLQKLEVWVVGDSGCVLHGTYVNSPQWSWAAANFIGLASNSPAFKANLYGVWGVANSDPMIKTQIWAVGDNGVILHLMP